MSPGAPTRVPWVTLSGVALMLLAATLPATWIAAYSLDRDAVLAGQFWRPFTAHFVHWTPAHLAWNVAAFALFGAWIERSSRRHLLVVLSTGAKVIPLVLLAADPALHVYRGLSGLASALFVAAALEGLSQARAARSRPGTVLSAAALLGFGAKLVAEFASGSTVFVAADASFRPVPLAHAVGALVAVGVFVFRKLRSPEGPELAPRRLRASEPTTRATPRRRGASSGPTKDQACESLSSDPRRDGGLRPGASSTPGAGAQIHSPC